MRAERSQQVSTCAQGLTVAIALKFPSDSGSCGARFRKPSYRAIPLNSNDLLYIV